MHKPVAASPLTDLVISALELFIARYPYDTAVDEWKHWSLPDDLHVLFRTKLRAEGRSWQVQIQRGVGANPHMLLDVRYTIEDDVRQVYSWQPIGERDIVAALTTPQMGWEHTL